MAKGRKDECRSRSQEFTRSLNVCPSRQTDVFDIASSQGKMSESLRKMSFRIVTETSCLLIENLRAALMLASLWVLSEKFAPIDWPP